MGDRAMAANAGKGRNTAAQASSVSSDAIRELPPVRGRIGGPTRRSSKGGWTPDEDDMLRRAVQCFKGKQWKRIAEFFPGRTDVQCLHRWQKVLNPELVKGPWTKEEDEKIIELVNKHGAKKWSAIAKELPGRIGKQCRERWHNHLNPGINKDAWSHDEELMLIRAHQIYGNKWAELAKYLPGRTDNAIKNHWNSSIKKKLDLYLASGLVTQSPDLPLTQPMILSGSSKSGKFESLKESAEMEEISECSQESISTLCPRAGPLEVPSMVSIQNPMGLESQKAPCHRNSDSESNSLLEPPFSYSKTEDMSLVQGGDPCHFEAPASAAELPVSSCEMTEIADSVVTGSSCCIGSPNEVSKNVNLLASNSLGPVSFSCELGKSAYSGENKVLSSNFCTSQHVISNDMVGMSQSLCKSGFTAPLPMNCSSYPGMLLSSFPGLRDGSSSREILSSASNSTTYDIAGYSEPASENHHGDSLFQNHLPTIADLPFDRYGDGPLAGIVSSKSDEKATIRINEKVEISNMQSENPDAGPLFYEPPRLPNLEVPFVNCDLINSCNYLQQAYSPLGVRQMLMSSANCSTPYTHWGSPFYDKSPEILLRSAAKTFKNTPSILRKRQRECSTPSGENHHDRRATATMDFDCFLYSSILDNTENSLQDTSSVDFQMFSADDGNLHPSNSKTTMVSPAYCIKQKITEHKICKDKQLDYAAEDRNHMKVAGIEVVGNSEYERRQSVRDAVIMVNSKSSLRNVQASGVLVEHNMNSPQMPMTSGNNSLKFRSSDFSPLTPKTLFGRRMETPGKLTVPKRMVKNISGIACSPCTVSPYLCEKQDARSGFQTSVNATSPIDHAFDKDWLKNVSDLESIDALSLERCTGSPFEWSSPWSFDASLLTEKDVNDPHHEGTSMLMNITDGRDDAVGLMKHLNEQTASAYAQAEGILSGENRGRPLQTIPSVQTCKLRLNEDDGDGKENTLFLDKNAQGEIRTSSSSYTLVEVELEGN